MKKVAFHTLGCKLNFAESSSISQNFEHSGFQIVDFDDIADLYVINTCTVTREAEKKCKRIIQKAHRLHPSAKVAVVGCFPALREEEVRAIEGVDYVLGAENKAHLLSIVSADFEKEQKQSKLQEKNQSQEKVLHQEHFLHQAQQIMPIYSSLGRTRSFFKIQDGCDNFCTYCAIPYARGRSQSASIKDTVEVAKKIAEQNFKEVVFTGVNIGDFGRKNGEDFYGLLKELVKIKDIKRWRISSVEPDLLSSDIIRLVAEENTLMPHFHIPLQAGSDAVLKQMKRHYDTALFAEKVAEIKKYIPNAFIAADVIVGFPTETPEEFEETYDFIKSLPLSALHVFSYSPRPEAASYKFGNICSKTEKEERSRRLHGLSNDKKEEFYHNFASQKAMVLWESEKIENSMFGYTENYLRVVAPFDQTRINTIGEAILGEPYHDTNKDWIITTQL